MHCSRRTEKPNSLVADDNCELLAFPYLFQTEKFVYDFQRDTKLSPVKHFNQRLLNYLQLYFTPCQFLSNVN